jgi:hypothetical protein
MYHDITMKGMGERPGEKEVNEDGNGAWSAAVV